MFAFYNQHTMRTSDVMERYVEANGLEFKVLEKGKGERFALLLHGFPDTADSMLPLMDRLADNGYTTVAPYMRGYGETSRPPDNDYRVSTLAQDAIALTEELNDHDECILIGHDWGAIASYAVATIKPDYFSHIIPIGAPPRFWEPMTPLQLFRSWYIAFFQIPGISERALKQDDFALIERLWNDWSPGWDYPEERMEAVKKTFRHKGTPHAALSYYRDMVRGAAQRYDSKGGFQTYGKIEGPILVILGVDDGAIGIEMANNAEDALIGPSRVERIENSGHFVPLEKTDRVGDLILRFVESN